MVACPTVDSERSAQSGFLTVGCPKQPALRGVSLPKQKSSLHLLFGIVESRGIFTTVTQKKPKWSERYGVMMTVLSALSANFGVRTSTRRSVSLDDVINVEQHFHFDFLNFLRVVCSGGPEEDMGFLTQLSSCHQYYTGVGQVLDRLPNVEKMRCSASGLRPRRQLANLFQHWGGGLRPAHHLYESKIEQKHPTVNDILFVQHVFPSRTRREKIRKILFSIL